MVLEMKKGQSLGEVSLLLAVVLAAIIGMQVYVKRGLQSRYKAIADSAGDVFGAHQYEPYYVNSNFMVQQDSRVNLSQERGDITTDIGSDTAMRSGYQKTGGNPGDLRNDDDWNW